MRTDQLRILKKLLSGRGLHFDFVTDEYLVARYGLVDISIQQRPKHCDRGRWIMHAESSDITQLSIDRADGFPRYYFHDECLVKEIHAWLEKRNLLEPQPEGIT